MAQLGNTIINGALRVVGNIFGNVMGNITTPYCICSTAANTTAKVVYCDGFILEEGARVTVKFAETNTASNPTLNVNDTGAKSIYYRGANIDKSYLVANQICEFVYNGTQYELIGDVDTKGLSTGRSIDGVQFDGSKDIYHYCTCSTAADTVEKAATVSNSGTFTLTTGAVVFVNFSYANTAANPTLNVNSTGAKSIYAYGTQGYTQTITWPLGAIVAFIYNGSRWVIMGINTTSAAQSIDGILFSGTHKVCRYAQCSTTAATDAKIIAINDIAGFNLETGTVIFTKFIYGSTASNPTLNVNSTGAKPLVAYALDTASYTPNIQANVLIPLIYSGASWVVFGQYQSQTQIDGMTYNGRTNIIRYKTCTTSASTQAKVASTPSGSSTTTFVLDVGATVYVKFTNSNTASNPTLNVNSTGAKSIMMYGTTPVGTTAETSWYAGQVVCFVYDGTYWQMVK